jgi:hypothetical protein
MVHPIQHLLCVYFKKWLKTSKDSIILGLGQYMDAVTHLDSKMTIIGTPSQQRSPCVHTVIANNIELPYTNGSISTIISSITPLLTKGQLEEYWRILAPEGHLLIIAPNKHSIYRLTKCRPKALTTDYAKSYTLKSIQMLAHEAHFTILKQQTMMYPMMGRYMSITESLGTYLLPYLGEYIMVFLQKQVYAPLALPYKGYIKFAKKCPTSDGRSAPVPL